MAERKLAGIAEQQIEAHRRDDEYARDDEDVENIEARHPQRN
jgi:hypothetical protein